MPGLGAVALAARVDLAGDLGADIDDFLATLGYPCVEETTNPVYQLFLRPPA